MQSPQKLGGYEVKVGHASNVTDGGGARYLLGISETASKKIIVLNARTETDVNYSPILLPYRGALGGAWGVKMVVSNDLTPITGKTIDIDYAYIEIPT